MGIGFIVASYVLSRELRRKGLEAPPSRPQTPDATAPKSVPNLGSTITFIAVIFGILGSKLSYLLENWDDFMRDPMSAFSPGGLTWYGGFLLATFVIYLYTRKKNIPFLVVCDAAAPALMIGYGIARVGCHLSGDGDYGMPTNLPWASEYSLGTYPPSVAFKDFPEIVEKYGVNGVVPDTILVHPTPIYELFMSIAVFLLLWRLRKTFRPDGRLFMMYLVCSGVSRFLIEFIRINPRILLGLSEAQVISLFMICIGAIGMRILTNRKMQANPSIP